MDIFNEVDYMISEAEIPLEVANASKTTKVSPTPETCKQGNIDKPLNSVHAGFPQLKEISFKLRTTREGGICVIGYIMHSFQKRFVSFFRHCYPPVRTVICR